MNTRRAIKTTNIKKETYKDYILRRVDDSNKLMSFINPSHTMISDSLESLYILDYLMDMKAAIVKKLEHDISWSDFEAYYNMLFSEIHRQINNTEHFKDLTVAEKDISIHMLLSDKMEVTPPDEYLARVLKNAKAKDTTVKDTEERQKLEKYKRDINDYM